MLVEVRGILLFVLLTAVKVYRKDNLNSTKKGPKSGGRKSLSVQRNGAVENVLMKKSILRCLKCPAEGSLSNLKCRRI